MSAASRISSSSRANGPGQVETAFAAGALLACSLPRTPRPLPDHHRATHLWMRLIIRSEPPRSSTPHNHADFPARRITGWIIKAAAGSVMLHQSKDVNGVEKMLPVEDVTVPAHGTGEFRSRRLSTDGARTGKFHGRWPASSCVIPELCHGKMITADFPVKGGADSAGSNEVRISSATLSDLPVRRIAEGRLSCWLAQ